MNRFGHLGVNRLDGAKRGDVNLVVAEIVEERGGVLYDGLFLLKIGICTHTAVRDAKELMISGNFRNDNMAHEVSGLHIGFGRKNTL